MTSQHVALVTAGATGIGRAVSERFLSEGWRVHICDVDEKVLNHFIEQNPAASGSIADVSSPADVDRLFERLTANYQRLDVLVNNAGIAGPTAAIEDIDVNEWERTVAVNLTGQFLCCRRAVPLLKAEGGVIVNIASNAALTGCPYRAPYAASKWAVAGLTKTLAMELGRFGVRVNAICPCSVEGERIDAVLQRDAARLGKTVDEVREVYARQSSLRRFVTPEDVAASAYFLASDCARNISGQIIGVDGHTETLANPFDE